MLGLCCTHLITVASNRTKVFFISFMEQGWYFVELCSQDPSSYMLLTGIQLAVSFDFMHKNPTLNLPKVSKNQPLVV